MFNKSGNYFFSISFNWHHVLELLEVPEQERSDFQIVDTGRDPIGNTFDLGMTVFEYYITPNALKNGTWAFSAIYDQQLKKFFETSVSYGAVLKNLKKEDTHVTCYLKKGSVLRDSSSFFAIDLVEADKTKTLAFMFDAKFLNLSGFDYHSQKKEVPFELYQITDRDEGGGIVKAVPINPEKIWIETSIQPQNEARGGTFELAVEKFKGRKK